MTLWGSTLLIALRALGRNPLRSGLTVLGVVIGVAAVIAMVSVGQGAAAAVRAQIDNLGTNVVMVVPGATTAGGVRSGSGSVTTLTEGDARAIARDLAAAAEVTWVKREVAQVAYGNRNWSTGIQGSSPTFLAVRDWPLRAGRFFTQSEEDSAARVAVLGQTLVEQLYAPGEDPIGTTLRIRNVPFRVIGTLGRKGQTTWGQDQDDVIMVPFRTAERRVLGTTALGSVNMIVVSVRAADRMDDVSEAITTLVRARHRIPAGEDDDFTVRNMAEMFETSVAASRVMSQLLAAIASISLLVGGIGIMNTLLVSVTERTREIGVRMAVGAKARHILLQFLVESTVLSLAGGALGALLGVAIASGIGRFTGWPVLIAPEAVAIALGFAAAVGLVFGVYPARRASRLDPIAALRHE
ncbi:MAG: ABC transporter permease [bacterium]|nr:ABC transporter permease [bacterium]